MKVPIATEAGQSLFRTGWFVESVLSASMVVLIIRTRRPAFSSRPGKLLAIATATIWAVTLALPYTPLGALFKFTPLPWPFLVMVGVILALYGSAAEFVKRLFYRTGMGADRPAARRA
jgi:Mg2+-importing ATPase